MENSSGMPDIWLEYCTSFIPQIKNRHKQMTGHTCNLDNPIRLTDKMEWLKIYDSTFLKTYCSDKYTARKYVKTKIGRDISIPLIGVYDNFELIDFSKLPSDYVLKTNHGSHTNITVHNGAINKPDANAKFREWLSKDWTWWGYEFNYLLIPRKIIAEEYKSDGHPDLVDYKFLCFNGKPFYCQVIADRHSKAKHLNYYNMKWEPQYNMSRKDFPANYNIKHDAPKTLDTMIDYATRLSADFKFVRVDFYEINGDVFFGELTFYPAAAYINYTNDAVDIMLGSILQL